MKKWLLAFFAFAASSAWSAPEPPLDQSALRRHMAFLADDALEGRAPGSEGGNKAAAYIAAEMQAAGLRPGAKNGSWYQPVALVERAAGKYRARWRTKGHTLDIDPALGEFIARDGSAILKRSDVIFAGFGIDLPEAGFENLSGVDVRNKVVLILSGRPEAAAAAPGLDVRRKMIAQAGASAVIALVGSDDPWALIRNSLRKGRTGLDDRAGAPVEGALAFDAWVRMIKASGEDVSALYNAALKPGFKARALRITLDLKASSTIRRFESPNVIGMIDGRDRANEAVFYLAHWDHLGLCRSAGASDRICNGAVDNASGVAELIEVARRLARSPARRSQYFVATTAEEMGLLGAKSLMSDSPVPLQHIVAALNFDTVAIAHAGAPVAIIGRGRTPLDPLIDAAARVQGRKIDDSDAANAFLNRQDGWELLKAGIPAVMIGGAFSDPKLLATFLAGLYHSPSDDMSQPIPLDGAAEDGALSVVLGRMLADPATFPMPSHSPR